MYHHCIVGRIGIGFVPDGFIDGLGGIDPLLVGCQQKEDPVFNICQNDFLPIYPNLAAAGVDLNIAAAIDNGTWFCSFGSVDIVSAENRFYPIH